MSKATVTFFIAFLILLVNCGSACCFNISTNRIEISVPPSGTYESAIIVTNTDKRDVKFKLRTENWFEAPEGWLKIKPLEFELKQDEVKKIDYQVIIPEGAKGELSAMIFIDGKPKMNTEATVGINTSIGIPIYAMVKGTEQFKAEIESLQVRNSVPLELYVKIKNSGNVHIRPEGVIAVKTKDGKKLFTVPLNEYQYPILPNSSRVLEIKSSERIKKGEYLADIKMEYVGKKYRKQVTLTSE